MKLKLKSNTILIGLLGCIAILLAVSAISASDAGTESREITGTITLSKDRHILQSGKDKLILSMLPPSALDSLGFTPAEGDTLTVKGFMSRGVLVTETALWKGRTFAFRDSLYQFTRPETGNWKVEPSGCISCRLCVNFCPNQAISMQKTANGVKAVIEQSLCSGCNVCIEGNLDRFRGCPTGAITK